MMKSSSPDTTTSSARFSPSSPQLRDRRRLADTFQYRGAATGTPSTTPSSTTWTTNDIAIDVSRGAPRRVTPQQGEEAYLIRRITRGEKKQTELTEAERKKQEHHETWFNVRYFIGVPILLYLLLSICVIPLSFEARKEEKKAPDDGPAAIALSKISPFLQFAMGLVTNYIMEQYPSLKQKYVLSHTTHLNTKRKLQLIYMGKNASVFLEKLEKEERAFHEDRQYRTATRYLHDIRSNAYLFSTDTTHQQVSTAFLKESKHLIKRHFQRNDPISPLLNPVIETVLSGAIVYYGTKAAMSTTEVTVSTAAFAAFLDLLVLFGIHIMKKYEILEEFYSWAGILKGKAIFLMARRGVPVIEGREDPTDPRTAHAGLLTEQIVISNTRTETARPTSTPSSHRSSPLVTSPLHVMRRHRGRLSPAPFPELTNDALVIDRRALTHGSGKRRSPEGWPTVLRSSTYRGGSGLGTITESDRPIRTPSPGIQKPVPTTPPRAREEGASAFAPTGNTPPRGGLRVGR